MPPALQGVHHLPLLVGAHPAEYGVTFDDVSQLLGFARQGPAVDHGLGARHADLPGDGSYGLGMIAGDHLGVNPLPCEEAERVGCVIPDAVAEDDQRLRLELTGEPFRLGIELGSGEDDDPAPEGGMPLGSRHHLR